MTKVKIDTPGVTVEIECDEEMKPVAETVYDLFKRAGGWPQHPSPRAAATGFIMDRRSTADAAPSSMKEYPGEYPTQ